MWLVTSTYKKAQTRSVGGGPGLEEFSLNYRHFWDTQALGQNLGLRTEAWLWECGMKSGCLWPSLWRACGEHPSLRRPRRKPSGAPPRKLGRRGGASKGWWSRGRGRRKTEEYGDMETSGRNHLKERAVSCANLCWKFKQDEDWKMFIRLSLLEVADHLSRSWLGLWLGEQC